MSTNNSKGAYIRPSRNQEKVNLLLVGSQASDADEIKRELGIITGLTCSAWYCSDPEEALDFIRKGDFHIDVIFLDLSLFNSDYPKEYFLQIKQNIPDIPIIVLTDRTDYDLQHFVMEEGAADNISQWQLRSDPDRLRNIVESCCSRDKISRREHEKNAADLKTAYTRNDADLLAAHQRSDAVLKVATESYAANMQDAQEENIQLRRDRNQSEAEADLRQAYDKSDAILKYTQDKGALELKKASDENKDLRRENDHARAALSGGYSVSQPTAAEPAFANQNETADC